MAVDTDKKRAAMLTFGRMPRVLLPLADSLIDKVDRWCLLGLYATYVVGPYYTDEADVFAAGSVVGECFAAGAVAGEGFTAGATAAEVVGED